MEAFRSLGLAVLTAGFLNGAAASPAQHPIFGEATEASQPPANKLPLVDSQALQDAISIGRLLDRAKDLYEIANLSWPEYNHPTRVIGSKGHHATLEYIRNAVADFDDYYTGASQSFPAYSGSVFEYRLVLGDEVAHTASPMSLTPPTKNKQPVHGDLVLIDDDGCSSENYPANLKGNIAFIRRGTCPFGEKSALAGRAGATAAVIYNSENGSLHGTMGTPEDDHVATFGIDLQDAVSILEKLKAGDAVDGIAYIDAVVSKIVTKNIVIQTVEGDPDNCVMLGAHSDSVSQGPGINDDGSGTLSLIEVAIQLTNFTVKNCVRFAWWSAEEEGLLGSDYYASQLSTEENLRVRLFMDYDMLASPNFAYQVYNATNAENPTGSEELRNLYVGWYEAHDLNYTFIPFDGRSDYDGFIRAGIPAGGIATGAEGVKTKEEVDMFGGIAGAWYDACYHELCDGTDNVNATAWELNTKLVAHSVATYAASFKGFPKRDSAALVANSGQANKYAQTVKYHGHDFFM
ncbi:Aminopeptidase Y [Cytospora mali]|uniref:Peptide hydrolase n=1 Tax=Cytospora mali TaxID=578113 RepID=A0A194UXP7_CYTMA|nr:Aminopeptidase Y [Valsa mali var. pyri (nom. inval.)]